MFKAKLSGCSMLKKLMGSLKVLIEEANVICDSDGMSLQAMDSSHISLVSMNLKASGFQKYQCEQRRVLGLSLKSMAQIIMSTNNDNELTLVSEADTDSLTFNFDDNKNSRTTTYELKLMDIDSDRLEIPIQDSDVEMKLLSSEFKKICNELMLVGDWVNISVTPEHVRFFTEGDCGTVNIELKDIPLVFRNPVSLGFPLSKLSEFAKATSLSDHVVFRLYESAPIIVEYKFQNKELDGSIYFCLAPQITDEEFDQ